MAKFTKANELEVPQSVGPYTDGDINETVELQVFEPHQGRDIGYKNPKFNDGSTEVVLDLDMRISLGTYTFNNRDFWENNNFNKSTFQSYLKDNLETHDTIIVETGDGPIVRTADDNIYYNQYTGYSWSIDALPFVINPNNDEIIHLDRYYDKNIEGTVSDLETTNKEAYELATEGKINYYLSPRYSGRFPVTGSAAQADTASYQYVSTWGETRENLDIFSERPLRTAGGGRNYFEWTITGTTTGSYGVPKAMENLSDNTDGSGMYLFKLNWGDGSELEYTDKPQLLESITLFEHFYEKPGFYSITGVVYHIGHSGERLYTWEKFHTNILLNPSPNYELNLHDYNNFASIGGISKDSAFVKSLYNMVGINPLPPYGSENASEEVIEGLNKFDRIQILNVLGKVNYTSIQPYHNFLSPYQTPNDDESGVIFGCTDGSTFANEQLKAPNYNPDATLNDGTCDYDHEINIILDYGNFELPSVLPGLGATGDSGTATLEGPIPITFKTTSHDGVVTILSENGGLGQTITRGNNIFKMTLEDTTVVYGMWTYPNPNDHLEILEEFDWNWMGWYADTEENSSPIASTTELNIEVLEDNTTLYARFRYVDDTPPDMVENLYSFNNYDSYLSLFPAEINESISNEEVEIIPELNSILIQWEYLFDNDIKEFRIERSYIDPTSEMEIIEEVWTSPGEELSTVTHGAQTEWLEQLVDAGNQLINSQEPAESPTGTPGYPTDNWWNWDTLPVSGQTYSLGPYGDWNWESFSLIWFQDGKGNYWDFIFAGEFLDEDNNRWQLNEIATYVLTNFIPDAALIPTGNATYALLEPGGAFTGEAVYPDPITSYGIYDRDLPYQEYTYKIFAIDWWGNGAELATTTVKRPTPTDLIPTTIIFPENPLIQTNYVTIRFKWNPVNEFTYGIEGDFGHYEIQVNSDHVNINELIYDMVESSFLLTSGFVQNEPITFKIRVVDGSGNLSPWASQTMTPTFTVTGTITTPYLTTSPRTVEYNNEYEASIRINTEASEPVDNLFLYAYKKNASGELIHNSMVNYFGIYDYIHLPNLLYPQSGYGTIETDFIMTNLSEQSGTEFYIGLFVDVFQSNTLLAETSKLTVSTDIVGCMETGAENFDPEAVIANNDWCTYPHWIEDYDFNLIATPNYNFVDLNWDKLTESNVDLFQTTDPDGWEVDWTTVKYIIQSSKVSFIHTDTETTGPFQGAWEDMMTVSYNTETSEFNSNSNNYEHAYGNPITNALWHDGGYYNIRIKIQVDDPDNSFGVPNKVSSNWTTAFKQESYVNLPVDSSTQYDLPEEIRTYPEARPDVQIHLLKNVNLNNNSGDATGTIPTVSLDGVGASFNQNFILNEDTESIEISTQPELGNYTFTGWVIQQGDIHHIASPNSPLVVVDDESGGPDVIKIANFPDIEGYEIQYPWDIYPTDEGYTPYIYSNMNNGIQLTANYAYDDGTGNTTSDDLGEVTYNIQLHYDGNFDGDDPEDYITAYITSQGNTSVTLNNNNQTANATFYANNDTYWEGGVEYQTDFEGWYVIRVGYTNVIMNSNNDYFEGTNSSATLTNTNPNGGSTTSGQSYYYTLHVSFGRHNVQTGGDDSGGTKTCFLKGTMITMADKTTKPIEQIQVGNLVMSYDDDTNLITHNKVIDRFYHPLDETNAYLIINNNIRVTENHVMYVPNNRWTEDGGDKWLRADHIIVGDYLYDTELNKVEVKSIEKINESVVTYNFEVENTHIYIAENVIVHNAYKGSGKSGTKKGKGPKETTANYDQGANG